MKKCIELEKAIAEIEEEFKVHWEVPCDHKDHIIQNTVTRIFEILRKQPDVNDVKVRCKDCEHFKSVDYNLNKCEEHSDGWGDHTVYVDEDDYCSFGVRKEGVKNE